MKRSSSTYRLQVIKEVVTRSQEQANDDPMASYIRQILTEDPQKEQNKDSQHRFVGVHFDEQAGGWIDDRWNMK